MASHSQSKVCFFFDGVRITLQNRGLLKKFIERIFRSHKISLASLNYIFCTDKRLLEVNREFLSHDYYTDIITFNMSDPGEPIQGEIYISTDRVRDNAELMGVSIKDEIHRVIFHGALHLCGYGDKSDKEIQLMRKKEDDLLRSYKMFHMEH
jgi:probable rRNA maturation factor